VKDTLKKIVKVIIDILTIFIFLVLILIILAKVNMTINNRDYLSIFGYSFFKVATGSMEPSISENDIIVVKNNGQYQINDVITYKENDAYITHRVIAINDNSLITKGDANNTNDEAINKDTVLGVVVKDYKHLEVWRKIFTTPSIIVTMFITLILFDFAFSYQKTDDKKNMNNIKPKIKLTSVPDIDIPKPKTYSQEELKKITDVAETITLPKLKNICENDANMPKMTTKELNNLENKIKENPTNISKLKPKEKDFLDYTIRLDLTELQKNINKKINRGE
jgi:signal peptidase I